MLQPLEKFVSDEDMRKHNKTYVTETILANRKVCYQSLCKPNKHVWQTFCDMFVKSYKSYASSECNLN